MSSSNSDLQQRGGSLNSMFLSTQFFQDSLGSTTGSSYCFLTLVRKSGTFSSSIFKTRFSRNTLQLTYRQWNLMAMPSYSRGSFRSSFFIFSQTMSAMSQNPPRIAQSTGFNPLPLTSSAFAFIPNRYLTASIWFFLTAPIRGVSPLEVLKSTSAPYFQTNNCMTCRLPLTAARCRGVVLKLTVSDSLSISDLFSMTAYILAISFLSMCQKRYSLDVQVWVILFTAPILQAIKQQLQKLQTI